MNRLDAEKIIAEYAKPVFGFALKRCRTPEDAEDLAQEIMVRAWRALTARDDIRDMGKFIWTVAHNALSNYYRDTAGAAVGVSIDEIAELSDPDTVPGEEDDTDTVGKLRREIAYLSKLQRKIVIAYYFENKKQADIAASLGIPLGTVKWHLFEAKKELKRGIETVRKTSDLTFNPIHFSSYGMSGKAGTKNIEEFLRSPLAQNICYSVRSTAKSVAQIADDLGVSPVYVEAEAEFLEEYGFLRREDEGCIANFIIHRPTAELLAVQNKMYKQAAQLFANDLYDELTASGLLDDPGILCNQTDGPLTPTAKPQRDHNFLLWALIPFIAQWAGENTREQRITFDEVATIRPDGGHNIVNAVVLPEDMELPPDYAHIGAWCGPLWNRHNGRMFWQIDSKWSNREAPDVNDNYRLRALRTLNLWEQELTSDQRLSKDECAFLCEAGYLKTCGDYDGHFRSSWQIVAFESRKLQDRLIAIGTCIKDRHRTAFEAIKAPYVKAALASVPPHLRKVREYELQSVFHSDGWFLLHCVLCLLESGKMHEPTEGQRKALTTLIAYC